MIRLATVGVLLITAVACGGDGVLEEPSPPGPAPTLTALQATIFTPRCAVPGCHASPSPQQGMDLSDGQTFLNTINVDVLELPGYLRIVPGDAADSYLYMKITADPRIVGEQMPLGGPYLSASEIAGIKAWIDAGATNN